MAASVIVLPPGQFDQRVETARHYPALLALRSAGITCVVTGPGSNSEIARQLFISAKTVSVHVSNILAKLGVPNRGAAAAIAREVTEPVI